MDIDNSVQKLVRILEPLALGLEEEKRNLDNRKDELESVSRLLAYTKDNYEMVGIYADQDLITSNLDKIGCDKEEYKASCYLLKSEDEKVKSLPQYEKAYNLISDMIEFFKLHKAELIVEIQELKEICEQKELENKYYNILNNANPLIEEVNEFKKVLNGYDLTKEEKIDILTSVIKSNITNYEKRVNEG